MEVQSLLLPKYGAKRKSKQMDSTPKAKYAIGTAIALLFLCQYSLFPRNSELVEAPAQAAVVADETAQTPVTATEAVVAEAVVAEAAAGEGVVATEAVAKVGKVDVAGDFDEQGRYIIRDYDSGKAFTSFLPGIAGKWGIPMWLFYVNKGQAVTSFGIQSKDMPLLEFTTAQEAYQRTATTGFRTFVKGSRGGQDFVHQPFFGHGANKPSRDMHIGMNQLAIKEVDSELGLTTNVEYFALVDEIYPGLVRKTTVTNTADTPLDVEILDGLARMQPFGITNDALKNMGRTLEGWYTIDNFEEGAPKTLPYFRLSSSFADSSVVTPVTEGTFAMSYASQTAESSGAHELLQMVVDPAMVFGEVDTDLTEPTGFQSATLADILSSKQTTVGRTACAMSGVSRTLKPGESVTITTLFGHATSTAFIEENVVPRFTNQSFVSSKSSAAVQLAVDITAAAEVKSGSKLFDAYCRYDLLDNLLRGGLPVLLGDQNAPKVYHTYSRIHGDPERDYNWFNIAPTFFSQGPGNFRDVNQNRRSDVLFEAGVKDFNIRTFLSFVQADGYNPLTVQSTLLHVIPEKVPALATKSVAAEHVDRLQQLLYAPIAPGDLFATFQREGIELTIPKEQFLDEVATASWQSLEADYSSGFWTDHWTYTLDQVESFLKIFPDQQTQMLWDYEGVGTYQSPAKCLPRVEKYVLLNGVPAQLNFVAWDGEKQGLIGSRWNNMPNWQRQLDGQIFKVTMVSKILLLAAVKFTLFDAEGMGIEMEGGKPGWNDAMNGIPGRFGSSMPESYEVLRLLLFLQDAIATAQRPVEIPEELNAMLGQVWANLVAHASGTMTDFEYWDTTRTALETYREATRLTFTGKKIAWSPTDANNLLTIMIAKNRAGIAKAAAMNGGVSPTYFTWEPTYTLLTPLADGAGNPIIKVTSFKPNMLPLFLEGPMRSMKVLEGGVEAQRALYKKVRASELYDPELAMYKICAPLKDQPMSIGRMMAFPPGWLERESIWLHMSYKFYLEMLRAELFEEYWMEAKTGLTVFMDPAVYGKSPLEASSFIVSSAHPDDKIHGMGFLARLSGSTAEWLSQFFLIMIGSQPFNTDANGLTLTFKPALPHWLFDEEGKIQFTFLGTTKVVYHNPNGKNTWTVGIEKMVVQPRGDKAIEISGGIISNDLAVATRSGLVSQIDVYLA